MCVHDDAILFPVSVHGAVTIDAKIVEIFVAGIAIAIFSSCDCHVLILLFFAHDSGVMCTTR